jgi:hypothetical protein
MRWTYEPGDPRHVVWMALQAALRRIADPSDELLAEVDAHIMGRRWFGHDDAGVRYHGLDMTTIKPEARRAIVRAVLSAAVEAAYSGQDVEEGPCAS